MRPVRRWRLRLALVALVALLPLAGGAAAWRALALRQTALDAQAELGAARQALGGAGGGGDLAAAAARGGAQLREACAAAARADAALRDVNGQVQVVAPLLGALDAVPGVGSRTRGQTAVLEAGTQLASAGASLCQAVAPLSDLLAADGAPGSGSVAETLRALVAARPGLATAAGELARLQTSLQTLPDGELDETSRQQVAALRERLPAMAQALQDSAAILGLLGGDRPRRFLVVSQNPDELRATGGYIGSAGVVEIQDGTVRLVEYGSSRAYDTPRSRRAIPPGLLQRYLGPYWHLAGANWSPSFPDVARQLEYFYGLARPGPALDGTIALDQVGLAYLLEPIGPVQVPGYDETVTAATLQAKLDQYVHGGDWSDEVGRKQFTAALSAAVLERALGAPPATLPAIVKAVRAALDDQRLLVALDDPEARAVLARKRWNGGLLPARGDALMLVDTEVTASKHSQQVARDADYRVTFEPGGAARANLRVTYANNTSPTSQPGVPFVPEYRTFLRIFVPPGATLLRSSGFTGAATVEAECGRSVFGGEVAIRAGSTATVSFSYALPRDRVDLATYDLVVQQQPGAPPGRLAVTLAAPGREVAPVEIANASGRHQRLGWRPDEAGLAPLPLAAPSDDGCGTPVVLAQPTPPPVRIEIPAIAVEAPIVQLGVDANGLMEAPATPDVVGWYWMSARAGQPGNNVMSGHVDWGGGPAVFWGLRRLAVGDQILVEGADGGRYAYAVEWNRTFPGLGGPVASLVSGTNDPVLTLITCEGTFNPQTRDYSLRRIVRARLVE